MPIHARTLPRILILGGGYAGLAAARRLSALREFASITLVDAKPEFEERIRLHQVAAGQSIAGSSYRAFLEPRGVTFFQGRVTALDPKRQSVTIEGDAEGTIELGYDFLVYALGSAVDLDAVAGVREFAHAFHSNAAAQRLRAALMRTGNARVLVVGGGLTGIETAAEFAECLPHLKVTLAIDQPWAAESAPGGFSAKAVAYLRAAMERRQVALRTRARVIRLSEHSATTADGSDLPFDLCIWTSGFAPPTLARDSGIEVNRRGQIVTDAFLRSTSHPNIVALGDAAAVRTDESGDCRMGCATGLAMATAGARTVAALLKGRALPAFRFVYLFRNICLGRRDGVIQFLDRDDRPRDLVWTGIKAAAWKEFICRGTLATIGLYPPQRMPAAPPLRMLPQMLRGLRQYA